MPSSQSESLPTLVYNVLVERANFFANGNSYIFSRNDATDRGMAAHCHYDATGNNNTHVYVGCCGGTGSTNCGENSVVELEYMKAHKSIAFFSEWHSSNLSNIHISDGLRADCNQQGWKVYIGCTPGSQHPGNIAGNPVIVVLGMILLISLIVNIFQFVRANKKKQKRGSAKEADTCEGDPLATGTNANAPAEKYVTVNNDGEGMELHSIGNGAASPLGTDSQQDDVAVATTGSLTSKP